MTELVRALQARGDMQGDLDARALGEVLFNNLNQMFIEFVRDDEMSLGTLRDRVSAQTRPIARLMSG